MAKFLSETGLQTVWSKIDSLFVRKASIVSAPTANSTSPISAGGVYSALEEIEDTVAASENALNTRVTTLENNTVSGSGLTANKLVLGNGGRTVKTSTYGVTTTAPSSSSNDTTIPTSKAVWDAFGSVASALKYKGTVASNSALPATHSVGDVYVVSTAGTFAGKACEVGDYLVCKTAGTSANNAHWDVLNGENQVENKSASLAAAGSSATIATVDGTDITVTTPSTWTGLAKTGTVTSVTLTSGTGITVSDSGTAITGSGSRTISLNKATTSVIGGMIPSNVLTTAVSLTSANGSTSSRYYGVQMDKDGKAFVNVPWTSVSDANIKISDGTTTNTIITAACIGTSSKTNTLTISASQNITATVGGSAGAATLTLTGPDLSSYLTSHQTIKQDGITGATINRYGICDTAAGTDVKTVSITTGTFSLETGTRITVYFTNKNTASSPILNVNSTGNKRIYDGNEIIGGGSNRSLLSGAVDFVYNSTLNSGMGAWQIAGTYDNRDVRFADFFGESTTAASTVAKTTSTTYSKIVSSGDLGDGFSAIIYHQYANSATDPTLNVYNSGAKPMYNAAGIRISGSTGTWTAKDIIRWVYDTSLNSGAGGWRISYILGNGDSHRLRLLTGRTPLYSAVTSVTLTQGTGITVSDSGTAITSSGSRTISLNKATTSAIGGMMASNALTTAVSLTSADGSTASRYYGVQVDKDGKAFVNIPWEANTHNSHALTVTNGTASAVSGDTITYVESVTGCSATSGNLTATTTRKTATVPTDSTVQGWGYTKGIKLRLVGGGVHNGTTVTSWPAPSRNLKDTSWTDITYSPSSGTTLLNAVPMYRQDAEWGDWVFYWEGVNSSHESNGTKGGLIWKNGEFLISGNFHVGNMMGFYQSGTHTQGTINTGTIGASFYADNNGGGDTNSSAFFIRCSIAAGGWDAHEFFRFSKDGIYAYPQSGRTGVTGWFLNESDALTTSEIDTILANAT